MALKVIGTDDGLLPAAVTRGYVMVMPGERVDVWADFSALAGKQVILRSLSFDAGGMEVAHVNRVALHSLPRYNLFVAINRSPII